ncbi:transcriptional repressor LexA [soil metagenome]
MKKVAFSQTHKRIGQAILDLEKEGEPAFVPVLVQKLGYAAESSLTATLRLMERNGFIVIKGGGEKGRSRLAKLTPRGRFALGGGGLPLLGSIPSGSLAEALPEADIIEGNDLLHYRNGDFLWKVKGHAMAGDGILEGDRVLLRPADDVGSGEIAAVLVGDAREATLKKVYFSPDRGQVTLRTGNPKDADEVIPAKNLRIAGVIRGLIRQANGTP